MCRICDNDYEGVRRLSLQNCPNIVEIPIIPGLQELEIHNLPKLVEIPIIPGLQRLYIQNCPNLIKIPIIPELQELHLYHLTNKVKIPIILSLQILYIYNCTHLHDRYITSNDKIIEFMNSSIRIKRWYKNMRYLKSDRVKTLWKIADYYTSKKYAPENALKFINLED